jgi:serine/threonine protein kinase
MVKPDPTGKTGYNSKADIWALGCILYELLMGKRPFDDDFSVLEHSQTMQNLSIPLCGLVDEYWLAELSNLLNKMLAIRPQTRKSALNMLKRFTFHYEL